MTRTIRITAALTGKHHAPDDVRAQWIGLTLPLSDKSPSGAGFIAFVDTTPQKTTLDTTRFSLLRFVLAFLGGRIRTVKCYVVDREPALARLREKSPMAADWYRDHLPAASGRNYGHIMFQESECEELPGEAEPKDGVQL